MEESHIFLDPSDYNAPIQSILDNDQLLLDRCDKGECSAFLRFWESNHTSIILGRSCSIDDSVFIKRCKEDNIQITRRISGGGTVLQHSHCLNYTLILQNLVLQMLKIHLGICILMVLVQHKIIKRQQSGTS